MARTRGRVLYLDSYTAPSVARPGTSSDAIGYGITGSAALREELSRRGFDVVRPTIAAPSASDPFARSRWLTSAYAGVLDALLNAEPDVVLAFHAFNGPWTAEVRRMMLDLRRLRPLVAYNHGSHWDPTDTVRFIAYPGLELADLANMAVLDRLLLVSEYMRATLRRGIGELNRDCAAQVDERARVVGLPIATAVLDACRTSERFPRPTIVFNHAAVESKQPALFARVAQRLLKRHDAGVVITRAFAPDDPGGREVLELAERFPDRVTLAGDLPLEQYYKVLWMADLQVSTATHESLGVGTLEAMYACTCCVLPRLASYPEITGGEDGSLYEPGEQGLEERLNYLLEHPEERAHIAQRLKARAEGYRPDVIGKAVAAVLDEVLVEFASRTH